MINKCKYIFGLIFKKTLKACLRRQAVSLSSFKEKSRNLSHVLCYDGKWGDGVYKTWGDFLNETTRLRKEIESAGGNRWFLYSEDCWYFLIAFTSLLQCKKEIILSANVSPAYLLEIKKDANLITDQIFPADGTYGKTFHIQSILSNIFNEDKSECPKIISDDTSIIFYTSGSTGTPKAIKQRLTELENDNSFIISKWKEELLPRKFCSTASQHHIYGLLFSILLPFTMGVPFRRHRISVPEDLKNLTDAEYAVITVPAFLKRGVEILNQNAICKTPPWIFAAGGLLSMELARRTSETFGFWPVEIYGSTETSGIAYRQSNNGFEWTPFDNVHLSQNKEGCLVIRSPFIRDNSGFETADIAELLDNGKFLLKGRIDSVVKIEEKRISLTEIETRILQSGFAQDAFVIPMEEKRQYLAAVVVLNKEGKEKFNNLKKHCINKYFRDYLANYFESVVIPKKWRYPEEMPADNQGKKKIEEIKLLFCSNKKSVTLEYSVPESSPFFDGHFPGNPILPAAAQTDIIVRLASEHFGGSLIDISKINRIKFLNIIRPNTPLKIFIEKDDNKINFKISSFEEDTIYSSGTMTIRG